MANQTALITGASSGIGRELAYQFAADGHDLVVVARRAAALDDVIHEVTRAHGVKATAMAVDLAQPAAARHIYGELSRTGTTIDVAAVRAE